MTSKSLIGTFQSIIQRFLAVKCRCKWLIPCMIAIALICSHPLFISSLPRTPLQELNMRFLLDPDNSAVQFYMACTACVAISLPILFNFILDTFDGQGSIDSWERCIVCITLLIPKLYYIVHRNTPEKLYIGYCIVGSCGAIKIFANILVPILNTPEIYLVKPAIVFYVLFLVSMVLRLYGIIFDGNDNFVTYAQPFLYVAMTIAIGISCHFIYRVCQRLPEADIPTRTRYLISLSHVMMPILLGVTESIQHSAFKRSLWVDGTQSYLVVQYFCEAIITMVFIILPSRVARIEVIESQRILEMKRTFVRFVSHEIRSPMNVVAAGLSIIQKMLPLTTINCAEFNSILTDIKSASMSAIDILNDLLNYEKIDAGLFAVNLSIHPLNGFFESNISILRNYVSSKDIQFTIIDECNATIDKPSQTALNSQEIENSTSPTTDSDVYSLQLADDSDYFINVDRQCLEIVTRNLLTNAVKFTATGGQISLTFRKKLNSSHPSPNNHNYSSAALDFGYQMSHHERVVHNTEYGEIGEAGKFLIEVRDTGAGMSKTNLEKLFEQFTQFDSTKLQGGGGSGLGLWICRKIMYMLGGRVYAHSDGEGRGSVFVVELPLYSASHASVIQVATRRLSNRSGVSSGAYLPVNESSQQDDTQIQLDIRQSHRNIRFLVVDDSKINRKILTKLLQMEFEAIASTTNVEFIEADDGDVAVDKLKHALESDVEGERIDCVLIDYVMVKMNGPEAVRSMRHDLKYTGLIIGITGNALKEDLDYFESCGCDRALSKPVNSADIINLCEAKIGLSLDVCDKV